MSFIDPVTGQVSLDPYAGQPIGGAINNIATTIGGLTGQSPTATSSPTSGFNFGDALGAAGAYYLQEQNIQDLQQLGQETQTGMQALGEQAVAGTEFRPYTVTSGLANITTTPEGGFDIGLSPQQLAAQQQFQGQATGLFGQVGADPATAQAQLYEQMTQLYEQMRAVQRPEEERQRLALEERMLSQGRLGLSSAAYGGASPELLAQETARQEAMARANLGARQQAMAEQAQAAQLGGMLQAAGYQPQQQALSMLSASQVPAGFVDIGRRTGAELASQLGLGGLEGRLQAEDLASRLELQQGEGLLEALLGQQPSALDQARIAQIYADIGMDPPSTGGGILEDIVGLFG
jgi:hypothetical protein